MKRARSRLCGMAFVAAIAALSAAASLHTTRSTAQDNAREAVLLDIVDAIGPATTLYLRDGLERSRERKAAAVILRMDTPGGLDTAMRDIVSDILASPIPVIVYVHPSGARAASAGTYILYASHLAAMTRGTHLGAATPVQMGGGRQPAERDDAGKDKPASGEQAPTDAAAAKAVNDAVAYIRGLADLSGRNADWAERAVRQAATLPAKDALEQNVVEIIANDLQDLLAQADGRTVKVRGEPVRLSTAGLSVVEIAPDWRARLLSVITNPNIAYILLLVGMYGILFEFMSPGAVFPGAFGAIALLVALFALNLMPINYAGVGLIVLGVGLMVAEVLSPSFGILGISGVVALALGSLFLFDGSVPGFTVTLPVVLAATASTALLILIGAAAALRSHRRQVVTGEAALLGSAGQVLEWSGDHGEVLVHGERWQARGLAGLAPGQRVRVRSREGLNITVEPEPAVITGERHAD